MSRFDYVVVGGGTAGCVVASRLSEDPEVSVLLLEAGGDERRPDVEDPDAWLTLLRSDADWDFETPEQRGTGRTYRVPMGKVLGGSGSINGMTYLRGHRHDFDGWASEGAEGWDYAGVLAYLKRSEDVPEGDPHYRGRGGPLAPRPHSAPDPIGTSFVDAARRAGHRAVGDFNAAEMMGAGLTEFLIAGGRRQSTATAYLRPAMQRPNLSVHTRSECRRLELGVGRCAGVEYLREGAPASAEATEEVILCAGAVGSPAVLLRSGIGPAAELAALGVDPRIDLPGVGRNLQDHPLLAGMRFRAQRPLPPPYVGGSTVLASTDDGDHGPDVHIAAMNIDWHVDWQDPVANSLTLVVGHMRSRSRGSVRLASADPGVPPIVDPDYLGEAYDVDQLIAGIEMTDRIVARGAFDQWGGASDTTSLLQLDRRELERVVRDSVDTYMHLAGTCRMGSSEEAVVDPQLRVRGVEGLRVADASVMPTLISSNTNAATVMIGEKAADLLRS